MNATVQCCAVLYVPVQYRRYRTVPLHLAAKLIEDRTVCPRTTVVHLFQTPGWRHDGDANLLGQTSRG